MIRLYNTDVAISVGSIEEAVVLRDVAHWCKKNQDAGEAEQDGRFWMFKSAAQWKEDFPELKGRVEKILHRLVKEGWLVAATQEKDLFGDTKRYAVSDKCVSQLGQMILAEEENDVKSSASAEQILEKNADTINRLYSLYPGKTETRDGVRSTGKCSKDKKRLASLLRDHTPEQIERSITKYIEEQGGKYLKNFSTFLNNLPEYEEDSLQPSTRDERVRELGYQSLE